MRIRKRKVPFPISSLSPIPISDPLFTHPPPLVQLRLLDDDTDDYYDPKPSDHPTSNPHHSSPGSTAPPAVAATSTKGETKEEVLREEERDDDDDDAEWVGEESINNNSTRKGSPHNVGALVENASLQQPASSSLPGKEAGKKWKEEVKMEEGGRRKRKVSTRKNSERQNGNVKEENDQDSGDSIRSGELDAAATSTSSNIVGNIAAAKKGRGRAGGAVLMEGSRCSRVNGRGWRCCQQTLVGYSLCEHHLGKGRLRSMNNVRSSRAKAKNKAATSSQMLLPVDHGQDASKESSRSGNNENGGGGEKQEQPSMSRRKMKLGVVKARSISSLLGQQYEVSDHDQL